MIKYNCNISKTEHVIILYFGSNKTYYHFFYGGHVWSDPITMLYSMPFGNYSGGSGIVIFSAFLFLV